MSRQREIFSIALQEAVALPDVLLLWIQEQPNSIGFNFLQDRESLSLTYGELDQQARAIATHLQGMHWQKERILLMYPPGLELIAAIMGCFYASVIAVPVYPPRRNRNLARLLAIATDAQPSGILTTVALSSSLREAAKETAMATLPIITTDGISLDLANAWQPPSLNSDSIALLQYTSGSTGTPKGVMLSHGNLLHNLAQVYHRFGHSFSSKFVSWLPPYHDMGLIGGIFQPLYGGFPVTLMAPVAFLQKPIRWLQAISQTRATTSGAPNFAYEMCLHDIRPEECQDLDLSSWEIAFTGAEPIRAQTLEKFATTFAQYGFRQEAFYPCYGLAEATLFVTGGHKDKAPTIETFTDQKAIVGCGCASTEQTVMIVDPKSQKPCIEGEEGEIWVRGASVAQGYWGRVEDTEATFRATLASGAGSFLRTGDLGFLRGKELFVTARIKDVIIIRGQNYYPQDIEASVAHSHEMLNPHWGAAFNVEVSGEERLVVVQEVERSAWRGLDTAAMITAIRGAISREHELQVYAICLLKPSSIPKTSSGKVQRHACQAGFINKSLDVIYQWELQFTPPALTRTPLCPPLPRGDERGVGGLGRGDLAGSKQQTDDLIRWLRDYANHHINSRLMDERRCIPPHVVLDFGNQGLLGMQVPPSYGGLGLGHTDTIRIIQQLGAIDSTLALFVGLNNVLGIRPILLHGTSSLKEELLPMLATGRELAAFALTEPGAGANPQAIASQAIANSNGWRLRGEKIWSGSAAWAGVINVFVQHSHQGISGFAVRRGSPGLRQGKEALTMGMRGMVQNTVYLEDVPVTSEQLLGTVGTGMSVAQDAMMYGRLAIAAACVGGMKRCLQLMWRYSERRQIATGRLLEHPVVLHRLEQLTAAITAVETLVMRICELLDQGITVPVEAYTACKISAPEFYWQAADLLVQTLGGRGYIESNLAPQILRDARVFRIFEGPTETLCGFLGARVLKQGEELQHFLTQTLGAVEVAQRLADAVERISDAYGGLRLHFTNNITIQRWASHQLGELASDAILWAAMAGMIDKSANIQRAIAWIKNRFEEKLHQTLNFAPDNLPLANVQTTANLISEYAQTIGDVEQTLAGEDDQLDELLRKSTVSLENPSQNLTVPNFPLRRTELRRSGFNSEIQTWLITWLSQKLHISISEIDSTKAFADYGIDSVTAVELAQDLQEWLGISQRLEATIAWNFPTIEDLARYLSDTFETQPGGDGGDEGDEGENSSLFSSSPSLEDLSAAEMAELLAQEIAIARQRTRS
ncbi:AMP-binding protein [Nostoc sp. CHAB 5784]|uniref:AMP-binding protein n=1 Tax=Nostoc mirabile TaxID=2907820 RepID=UPI001E5F6405|nr:AMP-binding protein [Nostoc mirabile]MCC5667833.1 AMP-binding protein [Nostoc mirabile CHAB5784]